MKSSQISEFQACWNLDFGVQVGLGKLIEMMPLSNPSVLDFGIQSLQKLLPGVQIGLSIQMMRGSGCKIRDQIEDRVQVQKGYEVSRLQNTLQKYILQVQGITSYWDH